VTKSRHFSTTFGQLRQNRVDHVHEQLRANGTEAQRALAQVDANERFTALEFVGVGHLTTGDAYLAAQAAARARENRQLARDARYDCHNRARDEECGAPQDQSIAA
jgi:phosphate starvation-inducible protein PhoH